MSSTTVNFNLKTAGYANYANQTLTFKLLTAGAEASSGDQTYVTLPGVVTATSDANGDGSATLYRNGKSGIESIYEVILPNREKAQFIIPSGSSTIELATLLVDNVPDGSTTQQSSVYASAIQRANHTGTQPLSTISDSSTVQLKPSEGAFVNGDKTKLDGIEANATADQTNAEIRAAVEAATDSNVFTDADHSKLDGIETSATADQTASEIRALVESATDSNVFTDADHSKLDSIAGSTTEEIQDIAGALVATGGTKTGISVVYDDANNNMDFIVASQTDENFTTADHSKLDGIEASADVTDTTNVTAAGALMDSEVTNLAFVKSLTKGISNGNVLTANSNVADDDFLRINGTEVEGLTAAEVRTAINVEDNADVTDTANVTAAGALMDSEVDADIKTLILTPNTTISSYGKTLTDDATADIARTTLGSVPINFVPNSISFNAATDNLSIAHNAAIDVGTGDFSLSFFARLNTGSNRHIFSKLSGTGYAIKFDGGGLILTMQDSTGAASFTLATGLDDDKWHTYVVTVDRNGDIIAYVDNVAQDAVSASATGTLDNSGAFLIGNNNSVASNNLFALGNYIILHKSVLSASQASQIYGSPDRGLTVVAPDLMVDLRRRDRTFKDISISGLTVTTNNTITFNEERITSLDNATIGATTAAPITGTTVLASTALGYTTGSGGTVTQATSKSTAVTLNKATGQITLNNASLAANTGVTFTFTNSTIAANDILFFNHVSGGTIGAYNFNAVASGGSAVVTVRNITSGSLSEAPVVSFAVIKAVTS